ncbi:unnamed protein product, partial [marine sediment metagenome]
MRHVDLNMGDVRDLRRHEPEIGAGEIGRAEP